MDENPYRAPQSEEQPTQPTANRSSLTFFLKATLYLYGGVALYWLIAFTVIGVIRLFH